MLKLRFLPKWRDATGDSTLMVMCEECGERIERLEDGLVLCGISNNGNPEHLKPSDLVGDTIHIVHSTLDCDMTFTITHVPGNDVQWIGLALDKVWPFR